MSDPYTVIVEANREEDEPWRLDRLNRVVGYIAAFDRSRVLLKLNMLYDHKGILTAVFSQAPTTRDKAIVEAAWTSYIGDMGDSIEFRMVGEDL